MLKRLWYRRRYFMASPVVSLTCALTTMWSKSKLQNSKLFVSLSVALLLYIQQHKSAIPKQVRDKPQRKLHSITATLAHNTYYIFLLLLLISYTSCKKADIAFGNQLLDNAHTHIIRVDTVSVELNTGYIDSFITSNKSVGLTGIYKDPWFGTVTARSFIEIAPPAFSDTFSNSVFDSLELVLYLNKTFYGDTTKPVTIAVQQLLENIKYQKGAISLYNTTSFATDTKALGNKTLLVSPNKDTSISIRMSDALGREWLSKLAEADDEIKTATAFRDYFKGLCIAPSGDDGILFAFKDSIAVKLHFHQNEIYPEEKQVVFNISNEAYQFNNIRADRRGTAISSLSSGNNEISSSQTGNAAYTQYITGVVAKLRFPYLRNLLQLPDFTGIAAAELRIRPLPTSFNNIFTLPTGMRLTTTENNYVFGTDLYYLDASGNQVTLDGSLQTDELYGINTYYSYDLTAYIKSLIAVSENNKYGLLLSPLTDNIAKTFDRLVIGDHTNTDAKTELIIYYLSVQ